MTKRSDPDAYRAYMREYMAKRRAGDPTNRKAIMQTALTNIITRLEGNTKPLALEIKAMAEKGLGE